MDEGDPAPGFDIDPRVDQVRLGITNRNSNPVADPRNALKLFALRKAIVGSRPDVVLPFMVHTAVPVILALTGTGLKVAACERSHPVLYEIGAIWRSLRKFAYHRATAVVTQTAEAAQHFREWKSLRERVHVIPNVVPQPEDNLRIPPCLERSRTLLSVGRLSPEKRYDLLIRAFAQSELAASGWTLEIAGDGPEETELRKLARSLGLKDAVELPGWTAEPARRFIRAQLYVLTSKFEGFPNALCEAMVHGCAPVSFDCSCGPRDIIRQGVNGILVSNGDMKRLARELRDLAGNDKKRAQFAAKAPEILERFGEESVLRRWDKLFHELTD